MITIINILIIITGLVLVPILFFAKKSKKRVVYKHDRDTSNARYAVNKDGYLEKISDNRVTDTFID